MLKLASRLTFFVSLTELIPYWKILAYSMQTYGKIIKHSLGQQNWIIKTTQRRYMRTTT